MMRISKRALWLRKKTRPPKSPNSPTITSRQLLSLSSKSIPATETHTASLPPESKDKRVEKGRTAGHSEQLAEVRTYLPTKIATKAADLVDSGGSLLARKRTRKMKVCFLNKKSDPGLLGGTEKDLIISNRMSLFQKQMLKVTLLRLSIQRSLILEDLTS